MSAACIGLATARFFFLADSSAGGRGRASTALGQDKALKTSAPAPSRAPVCSTAAAADRLGAPGARRNRGTAPGERFSSGQCRKKWRPRCPRPATRHALGPLVEQRLVQLGVGVADIADQRHRRCAAGAAASGFLSCAAWRSTSPPGSGPASSGRILHQHAADAMLIEQLHQACSPGLAYQSPWRTSTASCRSRGHVLSEPMLQVADPIGAVAGWQL